MLKKSIFLSFFLIFFFNLLSGQTGVKAGLNFAKYKAEAFGLNIESSTKVGIQLGITHDFSISDNLKFRPGILYSGKGGKAEDESSKFSYVDIPLSLVYNFSTDEKTFFAEAGPYIGILVSAKADDTDIKDQLKTLDFGLNFGLGYDLGKFIVGANYGLGLANKFITPFLLF